MGKFDTGSSGLPSYGGSATYGGDLTSIASLLRSILGAFGVDTGATNTPTGGASNLIDPTTPSTPPVVPKSYASGSYTPYSNLYNYGGNYFADITSPGQWTDQEGNKITSNTSQDTVRVTPESLKYYNLDPSIMNKFTGMPSTTAPAGFDINKKGEQWMPGYQGGSSINAQTGTGGGANPAYDVRYLNALWPSKPPVTPPITPPVTTDRGNFVLGNKGTSTAPPPPIANTRLSNNLANAGARAATRGENVPPPPSGSTPPPPAPLTSDRTKFKTSVF
jgi:hypothetical protein